MSNVSDAVRKIGEEIVALAEMMEHGSTSAVAEAQRTPAAEEKPAEEKTLPRLEDVRAVLAEISRNGKTAEMKALLTKFGATKLSDIDPADYPSLLAAAKEVQDA